MVPLYDENTNSVAPPTPGLVGLPKVRLPKVSFQILMKNNLVLVSLHDENTNSEAPPSLGLVELR